MGTESAKSAEVIRASGGACQDNQRAAACCSRRAKLPAGHKKPGEAPLDTAVRELLGETNLAPKLESFRYVGKYLGRRKDHWKCFFTADVEERELGWMNNHHPENEGEEAKFFLTAEFHTLVREGKFMKEHFQKLVEFAMILPGLELETMR